MLFDWDESNEDHIAKHNVSRVETEQALCDPLSQIVGSDIHDGEIRYRQVGTTGKGRLLVVAFTIRNEAVRPVTAFDADRRTARAYRQGARS